MCIGGVGGGGGGAIVIAQRDGESPLTLECYRGKQSSFGKHSSFWGGEGGGGKGKERGCASPRDAQQFRSRRYRDIKSDIFFVPASYITSIRDCPDVLVQIGGPLIGRIRHRKSQYSAIFLRMSCARLVLHSSFEFNSSLRFFIFVIFDEIFYFVESLESISEILCY